MDLMMRIFLGLVKLALMIGIAGGLTDLTMQLGREAVGMHKGGLVSLKKLNKVMVGDELK